MAVARSPLKTKHAGLLTSEVRRETGDPTAHPSDHVALLQRWAKDRSQPKRARRARYYLYVLHKLPAKGVKRGA